MGKAMFDLEAVFVFDCAHSNVRRPSTKRNQNLCVTPTVAIVTVMPFRLPQSMIFGLKPIPLLILIKFTVDILACWWRWSTPMWSLHVQQECRALERRMNTRGGAYPWCCPELVSHWELFSGPPSTPFITASSLPPLTQAVVDLRGSEVKGWEEWLAFLLSFSQEWKRQCLCEFCVCLWLFLRVWIWTVMMSKNEWIFACSTRSFTWKTDISSP